MKNVTFYSIVGGLCAGILMRSFFDVGLSFALLLSFLGVGVSVLFIIKKRKHFYTLPLVLFLVFSSLGIIRFDIAQEYRVISKAPEEVNAIVEGRVVREVVTQDGRQKAVVRICEESSCMRVLAYLNLHPRVSYGDVLKLDGVLVLPKEFETESGRMFDYPSYLAKDSISYQMFYPDVEIVDRGTGNKLTASLLSLKAKFLGDISRQLPAQHSALIGGVTVGAEESLGSELEEDFRRTGIIHIVVLSGYNVTIVAEAVMRFLSFLPFLLGIGVAILSIIFFTILTGASATIVRASIMAIIALIARASGRTADVTRALFLAGVLMLIHNPYLLAFDPSFQLSFLATVGLITVSPHVKERIEFLKISDSMKELVSATIATQLFVLPLILYMSGELSLSALPVNVLVLPVIPLIMLLGLLISVISLFSSVLAFPLSMIAYVLVSYVFVVVDVFSQLSFSTLKVSTFPFWGVIILYVLYGWWLYKKSPTAN